MKREILCQECGSKQHPMHPEDVLNGMKRRVVSLLVRKPPVHGLTVITDKAPAEFHPLRSLVCDHCNTPISDGTGAVAVTWWNTNREGEPGNWEQEYTYER
jgi:hypothetical protein